MSDELLPFYNRELSFFRRLGAGFARAHPKIAGRLRLGPDASEDPHVERLIQAFAYLSARTRHKLEDDFPELTDAHLGVLYPHYQLPIPSMAIVQLELDPSQSELTEGHMVRRGTAVESEAIDGEPCRFRTAFDVTLWPVRVSEARLAQPPFPAPAAVGRPASILRLVLTGPDQPVDFSTWSLRSLRFFLNGQNQHVFPLYQLLFNHVTAVAFATSASDPEPLVLGSEAIRPVGFDRDEGLLPYPPRSFVGYRLLTEYFAFPEKFLFAEIGGWTRRQWLRIGQQVKNRIELYFYLNRTAPDLEPNISSETFRLGCTPIFNLYPQRAEPIALTQTEFEYRVVPDARRPLAHEVYSIDRVMHLANDGSETEFSPFFSTRHASTSPANTGRKNTEGVRYWHATRRLAPTVAERPDGGTEVYLSLVDLDFEPDLPADGTVTVETTCLNRDLPHRLPFGGDQPFLSLTEADSLVTRVRCLTPPTPTFRPALKRGALWRLVSHLTLNHLSLEGGTDGADALREILKLYDFTDSEETRAMVAGILRVDSRRAVARTERSSEAVCRGIDVNVHFDEQRFAGSSLFLFASVLERFLGLYCSINSFTRLTATVEGRRGELRRWPPRMGERVLL
jgi:type VI secretion system protein ImpG